MEIIVFCSYFKFVSLGSVDYSTALIQEIGAEEVISHYLNQH